MMEELPTIPCITCGAPITIIEGEIGFQGQCGNCAKYPAAVVIPTQARRDGQTFLYRFFGLADQLLYVGLSFNLEQRFSKHRYEKPWDSIRRIEVASFPSRGAAVQAERDAIKSERPLWNVVHNTKEHPAVSATPVNPQGLVGQFFHSFKTEDDGCELVVWQGQVIALVEPGYYLVEIYEWATGGVLDRRLVALDSMLDWTFYGDDDWMRIAYDEGLSRRSLTHIEFHEGQGSRDP